MSPEDPRHGTPAGYDAHRRAKPKQKACQPCKDAAARYESERRVGLILGHARTVPSLGAARRVQALVALGWTFGDISERMGQSHDYARKIANQTDTTIRATTARKIDRVFRDMCMTPPPRETGQQRRNSAYALRVAARYGWVPPLAYDDIDRDPEPVLADDQAREIDEVVVLRILNGDASLAPAATKPERIEVARRWIDAGRAANELARLTGWKTERYTRSDAA